MEIHVVQRGQSLWSLSQQYRVSMQDLINANGRLSQLAVGQALVIPTPRRTYVVKAGDSLNSIAARFGTTASSLAAQNQITSPGQLYAGRALRVPRPTRRTIDVNAYLTDFGVKGEQTVQEMGPVITYLSPFSYHVGTDGSLTPLNDTAVLNSARAQGVAPLLVISNWEGSMFNSELGHTILNDESVQQTLINNVLNTMKSKGHRGLNIDFEYIYPYDREPYNQFLQKVVTQLHAEGYLVSTALAPKTSATQQGLLYVAHDYPEHGRLADFVVLMTYEWGWIGGPPMAVSPIPQIRRVLDYAVTAIPRNKVLMGVSVYGYDWTLPFVPKQSRAQTLTPAGAAQLAVTNNVAIEYNTTSQAPNYQYVDSQGRRHQVWFEDARSFQAKLDLVQSYDLRGISFWSYPTDFPQVPSVLTDNFRVRRL
ncbi:LysM peptidoglycan-binding domain-containing protein [Alicyclobacillus tolerans]|uniref:glycoside hydrolase family 18 protein n=1 Tax=Alicyclobacillus tolerans TaxID=90970 RepID=UPI001F01E411|nr:glycosyl hydrolase family 18 protein [Alicyclobacillus tolerans]MCF8566536.1 LysM peptidoglycan-binding domain-containing protein [Alicyclobacillus tolerans]